MQHHLWFNKFNSQPYKTIREIRNISDELCMENELSVIKEPQQKGMHYAEWIIGKREHLGNNRLKSDR